MNYTAKLRLATLSLVLGAGITTPAFAHDGEYGDHEMWGMWHICHGSTKSDSVSGSNSMNDRASVEAASRNSTEVLGRATIDDPRLPEESRPMEAPAAPYHEHHAEHHMMHHHTSTMHTPTGHTTTTTTTTTGSGTTGQ